MQEQQPNALVGDKATDLTVAELLLRYLAIEGIANVFGLPGTPLGYLLKALKDNRDKFTYHVCRQETGAGYMADGYARVTGRLGVCIVSAGPGATNALTGSAVAQSCGSPVLTISGEVARASFGRGGFQEGIDSTLDIRAIFNSADVFSTVITDAGNFQTLFEQALRTCLSLPGQAAHVSLPVDVGGATLGAAVRIPTSPANYRAVPRGRDQAAAEQVMTTLMNAKRPLLYLGNGCRRALTAASGATPEARAAIGGRRARFQDLTTKYALAVTTTPNAKGVFPESHPMSLRNYGFGGSNWSTSYVQSQSGQTADPALPYDALVVLGSSLTEKATNGWDPVLVPDGPIFQVDLDQAIIGRGFPIAAGVVAEIGGFIDDLIECGGRLNGTNPVIPQRTELISHLKQELEAPPVSSTEIAIVVAMNELLPPGAQLFIDASVCALAALRYMTIDPPSEMHNAFNMEPMGWAPAAVVGAAIGSPDTICIALSGDGGFMMNGNEISTAAQYNVGAIWVVHYNDTLAAVEADLQREFGGDGWADLYQLGSPNLAEFARGLGADAVEVAVSGFKTAFADALSGARSRRKPQVIVVKG